MEARVEIYENERAWIGGGFSKKGLLPNDRGPYSSLDGSMSWKTIQQAETALLGKGWVYLPDDTFVPETTNDKDDEWMYARDFSKNAMENAKTTRSAVLHWVRFRKLVRTKRFHPDYFAPQEIAAKCEHCDSKATNKLANLLLEVMAFLTLVQSPTVVKDSVAVPIKAQVLDLVHPDNNVILPNQTAIARLDALYKILQMHADSERNSPQHIFSTLSVFNHRHGYPGFVNRCQAISERIFPPEERDAIARLLVRVYDPDFELHCNQEQCGNACKFARVACPNVGCRQVMSKLYLETHDSTCPYKTVTCECGESFPQKLQSQHLAQACPLRDEKCPFAALGCTKVTCAKDIPQHVADETTSHLSLTLNRLVEVQNVISGLNGKVQRLQEENAQLHKLLGEIRASATKDVQAVDKKVVALDKKVSNMEQSNRKEFKRIRDHSRERQRQQHQLK